MVDVAHLSSCGRRVSCVWFTAGMRADIPRRRRPAGALLVVAGAVLWGTTGTSQALGPDAATPLAVGTTRLVLGGLLLVGWAIVRRGRGRSPDAGAVPDRRRVLLAGLLGGGGVAAYQLSFFAAVDTAGVALGTAVAIGSSPVFTGLIEWALTRRAPGRRWWLATGLATVGVAVLAGPSRLVPLGVVLALCAGLSYATYAMAAKVLLDEGLTGPTAMGVVFGSGLVLLLPVAVRLDLGWLADPAGVAMLLWLGAVTVLLAYQLFAAGLATVTASTAATLSLAEPLTAAVLGVLVLGERPSVTAGVGAGVVLAGLLLLVVPDPRTAVPRVRAMVRTTRR